MDWRIRSAAPWQRGWLYDVSVDGLALLVPQTSQPQAGQNVELRPTEGSRPVPCHVVRIETRGDDHVLVACERPNTDSCPPGS